MLYEKGKYIHFIVRKVSSEVLGDFDVPFSSM